MAETTSRILSLLSLLQTHRQWPGGELAARLGVTERTLRRDIERLRELGYRVDATRGAAGGYRLEAGSQLPPLLLDDDEAVTMAIGLRVAATQGLVDGEQTTLSALAKFEQVLPPALRARVNALAAYVQPQSPRPGWAAAAASGDSARTAGAGTPAASGARTPGAVSQELLGLLALACRDRERIRFHYVAADGEATERVVEPHTVVAAGGRWFMVCWDVRREAWRTFRVDRMSRFFATRLRFTPRDLPAADAAEYVRVALAGLRRRVHAEVYLAMPLDAMRAEFGPYAAGAEAVDAATTRWPIHGENAAALLSWLSWIPPEIPYTLHGPPEVLEAAAAVAERMLAAASIPGRSHS